MDQTANRDSIMADLGFTKPDPGPFEPSGERTRHAELKSTVAPPVEPIPNRHARRKARKSRLATLWLFDRIVRNALAAHAKQPGSAPFTSEHQALFAVEAYARQEHDAGRLSKVDKQVVCGLSFAQRALLEVGRDAAAARQEAARTAPVLVNPDDHAVLVAAVGALESGARDAEVAATLARAPEPGQ